MIHRKCLFLSSSFPPPMIGGSLVYYYHLLSKCTNEDVIVFTREKDKSVQFDSSVPYEIQRKHYIPALGEKSRWKKFIWHILLFPLLFIWIIRYRVSVVHVGIFQPDIIPAWFAAKLTGRPVLATILAEEFTSKDPIGKSIKNRLVRIRTTLARWVLRRCDCVLTISKFTYFELLRSGIQEERVIIITPGIDGRKSICDRKIAKNIELKLSGKRILLTVGRFHPRKGQDMVIRILPDLLKKYSNLVYVIAGGTDRAMHEKFENLIRDARVEEHVLLLANLDDESIAWLYSMCEIFIMPNRTLVDGDTEGYGIVFLEAGAYGKPVIGGRSGGVVDAVDDGVTGFLVDGMNPQEITNTIVRLFDDAALAARMGEAGREKVMRNGWEMKSEQYRNLINRLAARTFLLPRPDLGNSLKRMD